MGKKILVLTGSPRKNGITNRMAEAFTRGAEQEGNEVFHFDTALHRIGCCGACNGCWSRGEACVMEDHFNELAALLESCEVILIASPLYWFGFPAHLKGAIDRIYAFLNPSCPRPLAIKESFLFICGGDANWAEEYEPILQTYGLICGSLLWENRGVIQTGGLEAEGALETSGVLEQAEEMGRGI